MNYDPFQKKAIEYIKRGDSVLVSAPTGSGKTAIAEFVIEDCLQKNQKVIYTAPIKALSNQKFRDFQQSYPEKIGILTGDVTINPSAPILIMTTEIFRNKILEEESNIKDYSWIIFDEVHYIDDYERGSVWEESLIFLPAHMKMLALSATIPNIDELASWLESIHKKPIKIIIETKRPVPLHFYYQIEGRILDNLQEINSLWYKKYTRHPKHIRPNRPSSLIRYLKENDRLPCIYFAFGRRRCEYLADEIRHLDFLTQDEKYKIAQLYDSLCKRFNLTEDKTARVIFEFIKNGVAYHHAGMLPTLKEVIEQLFTTRLIKVIFTTETFALGINMPARTVVFDEVRKFYGNHYAPLKTRDFYQMAGRAGRRGIDKEGFVYTRVNPRYISFQELNKIIYGCPEKVSSRFNASYATILNLYEKYRENLYHIYPLSLHYFQSKKQSKDDAINLLRNKVKILKEFGCISKNLLTEKGKFASKLYGYELSLSELYEKGILQHLSETELGILATAAVFEPRKTSHPSLNRPSRSLKKITDDIIFKIQKFEKRYRIRPLTKPYHYHLASCITAWMEMETFDRLLRYTDEDEGEIIRYFRMALQILREMLDTHTSENFKTRVKKTIYLIQRDIIDAEKQLRS